MPRPKFFSLVLSLMLLAAGLSAKSPTTAGSRPNDLVGEWAVEWEEGKKKETEIIYIWFTQKGGILGGSALDPNLIHANISGEIKDLKLTFRVDPADGDGWAAAPTSTFKGRMMSAHTMKGRWRVGFLKSGAWKAWRTFSVRPSVTVTAKTVIPVRFTIKEHDLLLKDMYHETRRVGGEIEVLDTIAELGWLYHYRKSRFYLRDWPGSPGTLVVATSARAKILKALNAHGYPWTKIPE